MNDLTSVDSIFFNHLKKIKNKMSSAIEYFDPSIFQDEEKESPFLKSTVKDLRKQIKANGLSVSGLRKPELVDLVKKFNVLSPETKKEIQVKPIRYSKIVGPPDEPKKYGLTIEPKDGYLDYGFGRSELFRKYNEDNYIIGQKNYLAKNLNKKKGESDLYNVKIFELEHNWETEVKCLDEVYNACDQLGFLCLKESFISKDKKNNPIYIIVTSSYDEYVPLIPFLIYRKSQLKGKRNYDLTLKDIEKIYSDIINIINILTKLCISHSRIFGKNFVIHPETLEIKLVNYGKCKSLESNNELDNEGLNDLITFLYIALNKDYHWESKKEEISKFQEHLKTKYPFNPIQPCKRKCSFNISNPI